MVQNLSTPQKKTNPLSTSLKENSSYGKHNPATTSTSLHHTLRGNSPISLNPMSCVPIYVPSKKKEKHFIFPMKLVNNTSLPTTRSLNGRYQIIRRHLDVS
ncbi:22727_t:CDS:1 [Rhizophagus irregularis]|nr:22727_t:CDS:1 [Rhizophagus irregularis]